MPERILVTGLFRILYLSMTTVLVAAFLWPAGSARADVRVGNETVRVGIAQQVPEVKLHFQGRYRLTDTSTGRVIAETRDGQQWHMANVGGFIVLSRDGEQHRLFSGAVRAEEINVKRSILSGKGPPLWKDSLSGMAVLSAGSGMSHIDDTDDLRVVTGQGALSPLFQGGLNLFGLEQHGGVCRYRGHVEVRAGSFGFTVINELPVEQYLYGVVPAEMPASFPSEALKAQAVASRTYVLASLGNYASQGFDVLDTQQNQVYRGFDVEHPQASRAVNDTAGQVLVHRGQPIAAFFHSSSGGYTENCEDVWVESLGYIRGKEDQADLNPKHYNWVVNLSAEQLTRTVNEQMKKLTDLANTVDFAVISDLRELQHTATGQRVKKMFIEGYDTLGNPRQLEISNADRVRVILGLNSALFTMHKDVDAGGRLDGVVFTGSGLGHGLGMSQWGASGMSLKGYNYQDILQYYYTGADLVNNYGV